MVGQLYKVLEPVGGGDLVRGTPEQLELSLVEIVLSVKALLADDVMGWVHQAAGGGHAGRAGGHLPGERGQTGGQVFLVGLLYELKF